MTERTFINVANVEHYLDKLDSSCNHIEVSVLSDGAVTTGFGSDSNKDIALFKAVSEFFERLAFSESCASGRTSNGFACHSNANSARMNAMCELIERDLLTSFWLLKKPPVWVKEESFSLEINKTMSLFSDKGFELNIGILGKTGNVFTLISKLSTAEGGIVINANSNFDFFTAVRALLYDNSRAATVIINRMENGALPFKEIAPNDIVKPRDAFEYYLNPINVFDVEWLSVGSDDIFFEQMPSFEFRDFRKFSITPPWDLVASQAVSPALQEFYVGIPSEKQISHSRLRKIIPDFTELNLKPHPLA